MVFNSLQKNRQVTKGLGFATAREEKDVVCRMHGLRLHKVDNSTKATSCQVSFSPYWVRNDVTAKRMLHAFDIAAGFAIHGFFKVKEYGELDVWIFCKDLRAFAFPGPYLRRRHIQSGLLQLPHPRHKFHVEARIIDCNQAEAFRRFQRQL